MRQLCYTTLLFISLSFICLKPAQAEINNWCGAYFEEENTGYLRIAMSDIKNGNSRCTYESYYTRAQTSGTAKIALSFSKQRSAVTNWRKFDNHILEVRGKLENGEITSPRFVRDLGI